jgi:hypothetical protein
LKFIGPSTDSASRALARSALRTTISAAASQPLSTLDRNG